MSGCRWCWLLRAGFRRSASTSTPPRSKSLARARATSSTSAVHALPRCASARPLHADRRFRALAGVDAIFVCVPTPLGPIREPDLSYVIATAETIAEHLAPASWSSSKSTTYPGTTAKCMQPILEATGLNAGTDFFLAFSPEREDPGNATSAPRPSRRSSAATATRRSRAGAGALRLAFADRRVPVSSTRDGRGGQAHREHLPRRQHRARQRAEDRLSTQWASMSGR